MSPKLKKFLQSWLVNTLAVAMACAILPGIGYRAPKDLLIASLLLGTLNSFVRPILLLVALPLLILTLGLFLFVINALLLYFVGSVLQQFGVGFHVDSFWWAFGGAFIISIVSLVLNGFTGSGNARIQVHRGPRPPPKSDGGGSGPVIDV
jgi:putative membrane protein